MTGLSRCDRGARASALAGERAWLVGGAVRDRLLGRATPTTSTSRRRRPAAVRARGSPRRRAARSFELSGQFGAWRVVGPRARAGTSTSCRCATATSEADLAPRDFTINAMAEPLGGGELLDPHGGRERPRPPASCGWSSRDALADDPLRTLRAVRIAVELGLELDPRHGAGGRARTRRGLERVAPGAGVRRAQAGRRRRRRAARAGADGRARADRRRAARAGRAARRRAEPVPPRRRARPHARGARRRARLRARPGGRARRRGAGAPSRALLAEPLADELTRGAAMRFAALLHDAAKPRTRDVRPDGRVDVPRPRRRGRPARARRRSAACAPASACASTSPRCRATTCAWASSSTTPARPPHESTATCARPSRSRPTSRCSRSPTGWPRAGATPTRRSPRTSSSRARCWRGARAARRGPQPPLVRGDELAAELGIAPGPELGELHGAARRGPLRGRDRDARGGAGAR